VSPRETTVPSIALVVTVRDEAAALPDLLAGIAAQTVTPAEVVIADGGSTDGTRALLAQWASPPSRRVLDAPGSTIAAGRNLAIAAASAEWIAVTDAGVRLDPTWLAELRAAADSDVDVVSGFFRPDPRTRFERALGATVLPALRDVDPTTFLPSSRSLLVRRAAWAAAGGYPEWLDYGEDLVFDLALRAAGCRFRFAPRACVWFRPRSSWQAFFRQYYLYARGDGKAALWRRRHLIRYATYLTALGLLRRPGPGWVLLGLGVAAYTRRPIARAELSLTDPGEALATLALIPVIRLCGDVAKMLGYPVGVLWRLRRRG
jgi:glycosyltransferase involved in cell wall biosynthesis